MRLFPDRLPEDKLDNKLGYARNVAEHATSDLTADRSGVIQQELLNRNSRRKL